MPVQNVLKREAEDKHHIAVLQRCEDLKNKYKQFSTTYRSPTKSQTLVFEDPPQKQATQLNSTSMSKVRPETHGKFSVDSEMTKTFETHQADEDNEKP